MRFKFTHDDYPDSEVFDALFYNENTEELLTLFANNQGGNRLYFNINKNTWDSLTSGSRGSYYSRYIKGVFTSTVVNDDTQVERTEPISKTEKANASEETGGYAVRWHSLDDHTSGEPLFDATDEDDALRQFNTQVESAEKFLGKTLNVKIDAVIHYF